MGRSLTLSQKALMLVAIPLAFEFLFVGTLVILLQHAESEARKEAHLKAVTAESYGILNNFINSAMCIYLYKATHMESYKKQYEQTVAEMPTKLNTMKVMVEDSPAQEESLDLVLRITNKGTKLMDQAISMVEESDQTGNYLDLKSEIEATCVNLLTEMRKFVREQQKQDDFDPESQSKSRYMVQVCIASGLALNVVLAVALALYFNRNTTNRLNTVMRNTIQMAKGKSLSVPLTGTDEIAHLDRTFHEMAKALQSAAAYKQELISIVSHELRTPLTSVQLSLALLSVGRGGELNDEGTRLVMTAEQNTTRLIRLINDLLDFERMEAGKIQLVQTEVSIDSVIDRTLSAVSPLLVQKNIEIDISGPDLHVFADEDRLVQVMINLISNAIKFAPKDSEIKVVTAQVDDEVEISVTDQGRGVPPDLQDKIFERFTQVSDADSKRGSGLGLPICKAIIDGHGGVIGVRSEDGQGSTFWFRIPAVSAGHSITTEEAYIQPREHSQ